MSEVEEEEGVWEEEVAGGAGPEEIRLVMEVRSSRARRRYSFVCCSS